MAEVYGNSRLAEQYLSVVGATHGQSNRYHRYARAIACADVDIRTHYIENGGLSKLHVRGIGREIRESLEQILRKGPSEAKRVVAEIAIKRIHEAEVPVD